MIQDSKSEPLHIAGELNIPYIDLIALIKNKRSTGRLRDLANCEELEKKL